MFCSEIFKISFSFGKGQSPNLTEKSFEVSMASSVNYSEEQRNYFRICYVTTGILTEGLREIFKQEWDTRYKATLREWKDDPKNGLDFWNGES